MTPNEITTLIASNLEKELDVPFKLSLMERVKYWRGRLVRNSLEKDQRDRKFYTQTLLIPMKRHNLPACVPIPNGCPMAISVEDVPQPLRANNILFDYVGSADGLTAFKETTAASIPYLSTGKYSGNIIWFAWENRNFIEYGNPDLPVMKVIGVFEDPFAASKFQCCEDNTPCNFWDIEYPCGTDVMQQIVQMILEVDYNRPVVPRGREAQLRNQIDQP